MAVKFTFLYTPVHIDDYVKNGSSLVFLAQNAVWCFGKRDTKVKEPQAKNVMFLTNVTAIKR